MDKDLRKIFQKIQPIEPPISLKSDILRRIEILQRKKRFLSLFFSGFATTLSASGLLLSIGYFGEDFLRKEFWDLLSLIFSDSSVVAENPTFFLSSLAETFPINALAFISFFLLSILLSLEKVSAEIKNKACAKINVFNFGF